MAAILPPVMVPASSFGMLISKLCISLILLWHSTIYILLNMILLCSFGLVKSYDMPCMVESASLEPKYGNKFVAGGEDMWVRVFDFHTGQEIGMS